MPKLILEAEELQDIFLETIVADLQIQPEIVKGIKQGTLGPVKWRLE